MSIFREFNINMIPGKPPLIIHVSQYESDFVYTFHLVSGKSVLAIPDTAIAVIRGTKRDGNGFSKEASLDTENNKVVVIGEVQMTACAGKNVFELAIINNEKTICTANFFLDVERAPLDSDTIQSETVLHDLQAIIDSAATATQAAEEASASAASAASAAEQAVEEKFEDGVAETIDEWLTDHPEATTTVQDGSLTYKKLVTGTLGFVTPEMFGAVGDGVTDDTQALQDAINSGKNVVLSSKTYLVTNLSIANSHFSISGYARGAKLKSTTTGYIITVANSSAALNGVEISGIEFDCGNTADGIAITGYRVNRLTIDNCTIENFATHGIFVNTATGYIYFNKCRLFSFNPNTVYMYFGISLQRIPVNYVYVTNCYFEYNTTLLETPIEKTAISILAGRVFYIENCDFANWQGTKVIDISAESYLSDIYIAENNFFNINGATCVYLSRTGSGFGMYGITIKDNMFYAGSKNGGALVDSSDTAYIISGLVLGSGTINGNWNALYKLKSISKLYLSALQIIQPSSAVIASALCTFTSCTDIHPPVMNLPYKNQIIAAGATTTMTITAVNIPYALSAYIPIIFIDHSTGTGVIITGIAYDDTTGTCTVTLTNSASGPRNVKLKLL